MTLESTLTSWASVTNNGSQNIRAVHDVELLSNWEFNVGAPLSSSSILEPANSFPIQSESSAAGTYTIAPGDTWDSGPLSTGRQFSYDLTSLSPSSDWMNGGFLDVSLDIQALTGVNASSNSGTPTYVVGFQTCLNVDVSIFYGFDGTASPPIHIPDIDYSGVLFDEDLCGPVQPSDPPIPDPIPAPASFALMLTGLGLLGWRSATTPADRHRG